MTITKEVARKLSGIQKEFSKLYWGNEDLISVTDSYVHVEDVRPIAEMLDVQVGISTRKDTEYPFQLHFTWDGVMFMSIHTDKL